MKNVFIVGFFLAFVFSSCEKKITAYWEPVDGVYVRDSTGMVIDSLGTPNVFIADDDYELTVLGNPCNGKLKYKRNNLTQRELEVTMKLFPAEYKATSMNLPSVVGQGSIPIENKHLNGAFEVKGNGGNHPEGMEIISTSDISDLPRGFYRLEITVESGKTYWDNVWVYWP